MFVPSRLGIVSGLLLLTSSIAVLSADPPPAPPGLIAPLRGHTDAVYAVAYSPNGKQIITGSFDKSVRVWDSTTGKLIKTLSGPAGHQNLVLTVAMSPDGRFIASGGSDNSLRLWDVPGGPPQRVLPLGSPGNNIALSPDGNRIAGACADGTVKVINNADGKTLLVLKGGGSPILEVAFSPNNQHILALGADRVLRSWNASNGQPLAAIGVSPTPATAFAVASNGSTIYTAGQDGTVKTWQLPPATRVLGGHGDVVLTLLPGADGGQLYTAGMDRTVRTLNPSNGQVTRSFESLASPVTALAREGDLVAAGTQEQRLAFWNGGNNKPLWQIAAHGGPISGVAIPSDKKRVVSAGLDGFIKVWRLGGDAAKPLPAIEDLQSEAQNALNKQVALDNTGAIRLFATPEQKDKPLTTFILGYPVRGHALSHDRQRLALLTADSVRLLDTTSGQELGAMPVTKDITQVRFAPESYTILTISTAKSVARLEPELERTWLAHPGGVLGSVVIGDELLTIGADRTLKGWDLTTGRLMRQLGPLPDPLYTLKLSPDNAWLAAGCGRRVLVWELANSREVLRLDTPSEVAALTFGSDRNLLVTAGSDQVVRWWDLATRRELQSVAQAGSIKALSYHAPTSSVLLAGVDKNVTVLTPPLQRTMQVAKGPVQTIALTPDGGRLLTWNEEKGITLWNPATGQADRSFEPLPGPVAALAVARNGVLVAAVAEKAIHVFTLADGKQVGVIPVTAAIKRLTFSPNNQVLAACCGDQTVQTWNVAWNPGQPAPAEFGQPAQRLVHESQVSGVVFAPDNTTLHTVALDGNLRTWRPAADNPTRTLGHPNLVDAVAVHPDGSQLATGAHDGIIRLFDVAKGQQIRDIKAHVTPAAAPIYSLAWSPDGKQLLSSSLDRSLKLWDVATGNLVREFKGFKEKEAEKGHRDGVFCVAFSPDGKLIASGSSDRTIKLWNVADATVVRELSNPKLKPEGPASAANQATAHPGWVYSLRFTPDGKQLVSVGAAPRYHGYLAVWNVADGKLLSGEQLPIGPIHGVAIAPDGKSLVVGCGLRGRQTGEGDAYILRLPPTGGTAEPAR